MSKQSLFHTMRPSSAKLLIINLIIITWILGAFPGFVKPASGDSRKCAGKGELCGGIAGIMCCPGLSCKYDGNHPDAAGICVDAETEEGRSRPEVRPDDGEKPCIDEGGSIPVIPNAPSCCEGLTLIKPQDAKIVGSKGENITVYSKEALSQDLFGNKIRMKAQLSGDERGQRLWMSSVEVIP